MATRPCGSSGANSGVSSGGGGDVPGSSSDVLGSSSDVAHNDESDMSDDNLVSRLQGKVNHPSGHTLALKLELV